MKTFLTILTALALTACGSGSAQQAAQPTAAPTAVATIPTVVLTMPPTTAPTIRPTFAPTVTGSAKPTSTPKNTATPTGTISITGTVTQSKFYATNGSFIIKTTAAGAGMLTTTVTVYGPKPYNAPIKDGVQVTAVGVLNKNGVLIAKTVAVAGQ